MNKINYDKELEKIIASPDPCGKKRRSLMIHSCCAPCSSYCLIYLLAHFDITCFYYNPNITDEDEYDKRLGELRKLIALVNEEYGSSIGLIEGEYEADAFIKKVEECDLANCPEGGRRCDMCFRMRLGKTYEIAKEKGFDYFATTLTISPHKNAQLINEIGYAIAGDGEGPMWLPADFKKKDGYKQSIELSAKYDLYRQNYCGCWLSRDSAAAGGAKIERVR